MISFDRLFAISLTASSSPASARPHVEFLSSLTLSLEPPLFLVSPFTMHYGDDYLSILIYRISVIRMSFSTLPANIRASLFSPLSYDGEALSPRELLLACEDVTYYILSRGIAPLTSARVLRLQIKNRAHFSVTIPLWLFLCFLARWWAGRFRGAAPRMASRPDWLVARDEARLFRWLRGIISMAAAGHTGYNGIMPHRPTFHECRRCRLVSIRHYHVLNESLPHWLPTSLPAISFVSFIKACPQRSSSLPE